jgi:hypothetical protein
MAAICDDLTPQMVASICDEPTPSLLRTVLRVPASPLRPTHLFVDARQTSARGVATSRAPAAAPPSTSPGSHELERLLLCAIGEAPASSDPLERLAERCAELTSCGGDVDPRAALADARAALESAGRTDVATALRKFCRANLLRAPAALLAEHDSRCRTEALSAADSRAALLRQLDLQVQLRLALAAVDTTDSAPPPDVARAGDGVGDSLSGKAYGELKRTLQMLGVKLGAAAIAAAAQAAHPQRQRAEVPSSASDATTGDQPITEPAPRLVESSGDGFSGAAAASDATGAPQAATAPAALVPAAPPGDAPLGEGAARTWSSIDEYVMVRLGPRYGGALPRTHARLVADFHEDGPSARPDAPPVLEAAAPAAAAAASVGGTLALCGEAAGGGGTAESAGGAPSAQPASGDLTSAFLAVAPGARHAATAGTAPSNHLGGSSGSGVAPSDGSMGGPTAGAPSAGAGALATVPTASVTAVAADGAGCGNSSVPSERESGGALAARPRLGAALKRAVSLDEVGSAARGSVFKMPPPLARASSESVSAGAGAGAGAHGTHGTLKALADQSSSSRPSELRERARMSANGAPELKRQRSASGAAGGKRRGVSDALRDALRGAAHEGGMPRREQSHDAERARKRSHHQSDEGERAPQRGGKRPLGEQRRPLGEHRSSADDAALALFPAPSHHAERAVPPAATPAASSRHAALPSGGSAAGSAFHMAPTPFSVAETPCHPSFSVAETPCHPSCHPSSLGAGSEGGSSAPHAVALARASHHAIVVAESPLVLRRPAGAQPAHLGGPSRPRHAESPPMLLGFNG